MGGYHHGNNNGSFTFVVPAVGISYEYFAQFLYHLAGYFFQ